ncbi:MAG: tetratricopeptide repeat protein [bacterium]
MKRAVIFLLFLTPFITACLATQNDLKILRTEIEVDRRAERKAFEEKILSLMEKEIEFLANRIAGIEKIMEDNEKIYANRIELLNSTVKEIQKTLRHMNERIDTVDVKTGKGSAVFSERMEKITEKLREIDERSEEAKEKLKKELEELKPVEEVEFRDDGEVRLPDNPEKSYRQLVALTREKIEGKLLRKAWKKYREKFGKNRYCDTIYWTGESYYNDKKYNNAISSFRKVEKDCPDSPKREASMLRIAYSLYHIGKYELSSKVLDMMREMFPDPSFPKQGVELRRLIKKAEKK